MLDLLMRFFAGIVFVVTAHAVRQAIEPQLVAVQARLSKQSEIVSLVDVTAPKDKIIAQIDALQKEIMKECNQESQTFNQWLREKQVEIENDQQQADTLKEQQAQLQNDIGQLRADLIALHDQQEDIQAQLDQDQDSVTKYHSQLQDATDLRVRVRKQNLGIIGQHQQSLHILDELSDMIKALRTGTSLDILDRLQSSNLPKGTMLKIRLLSSTLQMHFGVDGKEDPQTTSEIRIRLLDMIKEIEDGIQESMDLYETEELQQQQKFENEIRPGLHLMIQQTQQHIVSLQQQLSQALAQIQSDTLDLEQAETDLDQVQNQLPILQGVIQSFQSQIQSATNTHSQKQDRCHADLSDLETVRQYVVQHISGLTPGNNCNPESKSCDRCLFDDHCPKTQVCSDEGKCQMPPPPPYWQLLPKSPPTDRPVARRIDVGIVPQSSFQLGDCTYVFKYKLLTDRFETYDSIFNVVNVGEGDRITEQVKVAQLGSQMVIDIRRGGIPWPNNWWGSFFSIDRFDVNQWNAIALSVSSSTKTVTFVYRYADGKVFTKVFPGFHGNLAKFEETGVFASSSYGWTIAASYADFRRYDSALSNDQILSIFNEFFQQS